MLISLKKYTGEKGSCKIDQNRNGKKRNSGVAVPGQLTLIGESEIEEVSFEKYKKKNNSKILDV